MVGKLVRCEVLDAVVAIVHVKMGDAGATISHACVKHSFCLLVSPLSFQLVLAHAVARRKKVVT